MQIYLCGFSGRKLDKLRRLINSGGGVRFNQLNGDVTHVIVGDYDDELKHFWNKSAHRFYQFLIQSSFYCVLILVNIAVGGGLICDSAAFVGLM